MRRIVEKNVLKNVCFTFFFFFFLQSINTCASIRAEFGAGDDFFLKVTDRSDSRIDGRQISNGGKSSLVSVMHAFLSSNE